MMTDQNSHVLSVGDGGERKREIKLRKRKAKKKNKTTWE
jgi:hypothetical protein